VQNSRINTGDVVIIPSTDYRDLRKAAFQQYSIASSFNAIRIPQGISVNSGSILGVAFVSAALALGICMGLDFQAVENGPDLLSIVRTLDPEKLPNDIRQECLQGVIKGERAKAGDFLVIWGGGSTCAHVTKQIARLAGLKIISVVDSAKHGLRLSSTKATRPDLVVDSHDSQRAIDIIKASTCDSARFGFDTQGKESAGHLLRSLAIPGPEVPQFQNTKVFERAGAKLPTPPSTPLRNSSRTQRSHLVGLTGLPKTAVPESIALHSVPIKLFHEIPEVGEALSAWCERLLLKGLLVPPDVVGTVDGLDGINEGLDRMRRREISGGRLVAVLK
jgi:NADPH:quinone reductase-like Zn-dependent oxidoreductase